MPQDWKNAEFIHTVHTVTYALFVGRGGGNAQINIFSR